MSLHVVRVAVGERTLQMCELWGRARKNGHCPAALGGAVFELPQRVGSAVLDVLMADSDARTLSPWG